MEDSRSDALLLERRLMRGGYQPELERVDALPDLVAALAREPWDIVISDFLLDGWTGMDALRIVRDRDGELPFILVSGAVGEETAVEAIKAGAHDYLLKDRLTRLPTAVAHALEEAELRRERRRARAATAFLADASARLSASLDPETVARTLVELVVPALADGATLDLVDDAGVRRPAVRHGATSSAAPPTSLPLVVRGATTGVLHLQLGDAARAFGLADASVGEALAARAALALEHARLYRRAQDAIAARDEFLTIAAHELRTPLTPLSLQLQTLARTQPDAASRLGKDLEASLRSVERLTRLVDHLLDVSTLQSGALILHPEPVDLAALVREVAEGWHAQARASACVLDVRVEDGVHGIWDRERIAQAIAHLLSNALKFGAGKPVSVALARGADRVRLRVQDQGPGFAPADRARLFEPFARGVSVRRYGGFGLGLWVVRQVVEAHGGTVEADGDAEGGAALTITLPLSIPQQAYA